MSAYYLAIFGMGGPWELVIIGGVVLLFFGNRIPGMARSLGSGIVEFRKGLKGEDDDDKGRLPEGDKSSSTSKSSASEKEKV